MGKSSYSAKNLYYLYIKIALASLVVASLTAYGLNIGKRLGYKYLPQIDASMEVRLEVLTAHLWLEKIISERDEKNIEFVWSSLSKADDYITAMLEGGVYNEGIIVPLDDKNLHATLLSLRSNFRKLRHISQQRYFIFGDKTTDSELEYKYSQIFNEFVTVADNTGMYLKNLYQEELILFRIIQVTLMISYVCLVIWVAYVLNKYEAAKKKDFNAINKVKESLNDELVYRKNIEIALRASENRYRNLIESADDLIFTLSEEGVILSLNKAFEEITGWQQTNWIGKEYAKLIHPDDLEQSKLNFTKNLKEKTVPIHELRILTKGGRYVNGEFKFSLITDSKGYKNILGIARDITERKVIQDALDHIEKKYRTLVSNLPLGAFRSTIDGNVLSANPALVKMLGYDSEDEYKLQPALKSYFIPEQRKLFIDELKKNGKVENFESQMVRKDGSVIWASSSVHAVHGEDGKIKYFDGIEQDITERKRIENERNILFKLSQLYLTSEKSELFYNKISDILASGLHFPISFIELLNKDKNEMVLIGASGFEIDNDFQISLPIEESPSGSVILNDAVFKQNNIEFNCSNRVNSLLNLKIKSIVSISIKSRHEIIGTISLASHREQAVEDSLIGSFKVIADFIGLIVDHYHTEDALRRSESNFQELFNSVREGIGVVDKDEIIQFCNPEFVQIFEENSSESIIGKSLLSYIPKEYKQLLLKQTLKRKQNTSSQYELEITTAKNNIKTLYVSVSPRFDSDSNYNGAFGAVLDITDIKKAEEEIKKFKAISDNASFGVIITDSDGNIQYSNNSFAHMHGYKEREVRGTNIDRYLFKQELIKFHYAIDKLLDSGKFGSLEFDHIHSKGRKFTTLMNGVVIKGIGNQVKYIALLTTDISKTKKLHEFAERAMRLETAGRIAGQVAHDFNNLLGPLLAYPELMKDELPSGHPALNLAEVMENAAAQMASINQQLLTLSRRGHYNLEPVNLNTIINLVLEQNLELMEGIHFNLQLASDLDNTNGGESQIYRVLSNLINNAADAMNNSGTITIKSENWKTDSYTGKFTKIPKGEYVKISISDSGIGIPDDILSKIFEPFFTTKMTDKKRGSGLGLTVVHNVVIDHNGFIDIENTNENGTTFFLYFPAIKDAIINFENAKIIGGNEQILIIDDDELQRNVMSKLFKKLGYNYLLAKSGEEGIKLLKKESPDLMIIDMIMPDGMDGTDTLKEALKISPNQKAIIVSGFSESERVKQALELGAGKFVKKPLILKTLADAVREELDRNVEICSN